jgi:iron complex transport system permease protein
MKASAGYPLQFQMKNFKPLLLFALVLCSIGTLVQGATPWSIVWPAALERVFGNSIAWNPLLDERLPRLIVILSTGASLAVAGAVMQSLFNNALASPNILGISCGGSLCVVMAFMMGFHQNYPFVIPIAAFAGSLITLLFVYNLSRNNGSVDLNNLILTGIAISTLLFAIQAAIMYALRDQWMLIQSLTEWEAGSTLDRSWKHVHMQLPLTIVGLAGCWHYRGEIDLLALGEDEAKNLGVDVEQVRWRLFLCVALLTGGALAAVGIIAFFGLVLPHLVRFIQGPSNHQLITLCMVAGALTFAVMDLLLRVFEVHALSIGNISAILGGIFFIILLRGSQTAQARNT